MFFSPENQITLVVGNQVWSMIPRLVSLSMRTKASSTLNVQGNSAQSVLFTHTQTHFESYTVPIPPFSKLTPLFPQSEIITSPSSTHDPRTTPHHRTRSINCKRTPRQREKLGVIPRLQPDRSTLIIDQSYGLGLHCADDGWGDEEACWCWLFRRSSSALITLGGRIEKGKWEEGRGKERSGSKTQEG